MRTREMIGTIHLFTLLLDSQNHVDIVKLLLLTTTSTSDDDNPPATIFVDAKNNYHETPLHQACWLGREKSSRILLEHGANAQAKNKDQQTPIDYARVRGHTELWTILPKYA